ncbi:hypothetical protein B4Q13_18865, partial [Lacticaseibacillus rhamnosus]
SGRKIVITGDTRPSASTSAIARDADLLIHEATFGDEEADRAAETGHSTAREAATIARDAAVRRLALTHFSARYSRDAAAASNARSCQANGPDAAPRLCGCRWAKAPPGTRAWRLERPREPAGAAPGPHDAPDRGEPRPRLPRLPRDAAAEAGERRAGLGDSAAAGLTRISTDATCQSQAARCYPFKDRSRALCCWQTAGGNMMDEPDRWRHMSTAPRDGSRILVTVRPTE